MKFFYFTFFLILMISGLSYNTEKKKIQSRFLTIDLKPKTGLWEGWVKFSHYAPQSGIKPKQFFQNNKFFIQKLEKDEDKRGLKPFSIIPSKFHFLMSLTKKEMTFKLKSGGKVYDQLRIDEIESNGLKVIGEYKEGSCLEINTIVRDDFYINDIKKTLQKREELKNFEDINMYNTQYTPDRLDTTGSIEQSVRENWILCFEDKNERIDFYSKLIKIVNEMKNMQIKHVVFNELNNFNKFKDFKLDSLSPFSPEEHKNKNYEISKLSGQLSSHQKNASTIKLNITLKDNSTFIENKLLPIVDQKEFIFSMKNKTQLNDELLIEPCSLENENENEGNVKMIRNKKIEIMKQNLEKALKQEDKLESLYINEIKLQSLTEDKILEEKKKKEEKKTKVFLNILKEQEKEENKLKEERKIRKELNEMKEKTKTDIEKRREELRKKILEIKTRAAIRRLKIEHDIEIIKQRLLENKLKADRNGDYKTCLKILMSPQNLINKYCQDNYKQEKLSECEDRNNFCYMCCEAEIGGNHISKRDQCYDLCDRISRKIKK
jgi:hypothetical protein